MAYGINRRPAMGVLPSTAQPRLPMPPELKAQMATQRLSSGSGLPGRLSGTLRLPGATSSNGIANPGAMGMPEQLAGPDQMRAPGPFGMPFGMGAPFGMDSIRPELPRDPITGQPRPPVPPGQEPKVYTSGGNAAGLLASLFSGKW